MYFGRLNLDNAYQDGYDTGLSWKDKYVPGGPFVSSHGKCKSECKGCDFQLYPALTCAQAIEFSTTSRRIADTWLKGWRDGFAAQGKQKYSPTQ